MKNYYIKNYVLLITFFVALFAVSCTAQSPTFLKGRCPSPYSNTYSTLTMLASGDIGATPCPTRNFLVNGSAVGTGDISGTGTATYVPLFTGAKTLGNSRIRQYTSGADDILELNTWGVDASAVLVSNSLGQLYFGNTTDNISLDTLTGNLQNNFATSITSITNQQFSRANAHAWNNQNNNADFRMELIPDTLGASRFRVGDLTNDRNVLDINESEDSFTLQADTTLLKGRNNARILIGKASGATEFISADASASITLNSVRVVVGDSDETQNGLTFSVRDAPQKFTFSSASSNSVTFLSTTRFELARDITNGGTTGNRTINLANGSVNFAAGATTLTVTNNTINTNSLIIATAQTNDSTCSVKNVVASAGSFVINMTAACTAETRVAFWVTN